MIDTMKYFKLISSSVLAVIILFAACGKSDVSIQQTQTKLSVSFVAEPFVENEGTKSSYIDGSFQWNETDTVGIYPNTGSQIYFSMAEGAGTSSAVFDGGGWGFRENAVYYSYYPFIADFYLDIHSIPVSFSHQIQSNPSSLDHFGKFDYMYTPASMADNGSLVFSYKHMVCIIRVNATLPAGSYRQITVTAPTPVFVKNGHFDLQSETPEIVADESSCELTVSFKDPITVDGSTPFYAYLISNPVNLKGVGITVSAVNSEKQQLDCKKTPSSNYEAANLYGLGCSSWTEVPQTVGFALEDWGEGGKINGEAE